MSIKVMLSRVFHAPEAKPVAKVAVEPMDKGAPRGGAVVNPLMLAGLFID